MEIDVVRYDHPDARVLTAQVQQVYVELYGSQDETPVDPDEFVPPEGVFFLGYLEGAPTACGGWRRQDGVTEGFTDGDAEIKRMYVVPGRRGRGLARQMLAHLEDSARRAGRARMVLETGVLQPDAVALYESSGYTRIPNFGYYKETALSLCLAKAL